MKNLHKNSDGFTHHLMFAALLVGVVGLLVFTGRKVWVESTKKKAAVSTSTAPANSGTETPASAAVASPAGSVTVKKSGTAASVATPPATQSKVKESQKIDTKQNVTTPKGSLIALLDELKAGRYTNVLYFITGNFMDNSAELLAAVGSVNVNDCKANAACNVLLNTPTSDVQGAVLSAYDPADISLDGTTLTYTVKLDSGVYPSQPSSSDGNYTVKVDMVDTGTNWLLDRISLNSVSL